MDIVFVVDENIEKGQLIGNEETVDAIIAELAADKKEIKRLLEEIEQCKRLQASR